MTGTQSFQFVSSPLRLFHGEDSLRRLGPELDRLGCRRAAVFSAPFLEGPLLDRIREALCAASARSRTARAGCGAPS